MHAFAPITGSSTGMTVLAYFSGSAALAVAGMTIYTLNGLIVNNHSVGYTVFAGTT
jgi:hypothetical protein